MPGYKIEKTAPRSTLSRWLNPKNLPNCYLEEESTFEEYEKQFEQVLANALEAKDLPKTAKALEALAGLYCAQAKFAQGESLYLRALEVQDKDPRLRRGEAPTLHNLAMVYRIEAKDAAADKTEQKANSL
jgi:tetratricopeptide (TPR) repeat protein